MELNKIENTLEKYFEGESTIVEELALQTYFSSSNVAQHLIQYVPLFKFYAQEKTIEMPGKVLAKAKNRRLMWLPIAATILVFVGVGTFTFYNQESPKSMDYGTADSPEEAFKQTQKALNLLSENVNVGVQTVGYIEEFENSKNKIFKTN